MNFVVSQACHDLGLRSTAVILRGVNVGPTPEALREEIAQEVQAIQARFPDPRAVWALPEVVAFADVLRRVGIDPRREQPSVGRLLGAACKRGRLPAINSLVDAYNLESVRTLCSMGAHDLDRIALPVSLRLLRGDESFVPLGKGEPVRVEAGEFGYVDGSNRVLCRLDVLQADFSKVTEGTQNVLVIVEATAAHAEGKLAEAVAEAVRRILRHCGGIIEELEGGLLS